MRRYHEIESLVERVSGRKPLSDTDHKGRFGIRIHLTPDEAHAASSIETSLREANIPVERRKFRTFKGAQLFIPLVNLGSAWDARWDFDRGQAA